MQRLLMVLLVISLSGSATGKLDPDSLKTAPAVINLLEKIEQIYQIKNRENKKTHSPPK